MSHHSNFSLSAPSLNVCIGSEEINMIIQLDSAIVFCLSLLKVIKAS